MLPLTRTPTIAVGLPFVKIGSHANPQFLLFGPYLHSCVCMCVCMSVCLHLGQLTPQKRMGGVYGCGYSGNKREERRCRVHVHRCYVIFVLLGLGLHTCV